jgi:hypothetical protein
MRAKVLSSSCGLRILLPVGVLGCADTIPSEPIQPDSTTIDAQAIGQIALLRTSLEDSLVHNLLGALQDHEAARPLRNAVTDLRIAVVQGDLHEAMSLLRAVHAESRQLAGTMSSHMTDRVTAAVVELLFTALAQRVEVTSKDSGGTR